MENGPLKKQVLRMVRRVILVGYAAWRILRLLIGLSTLESWKMYKILYKCHSYLARRIEG